MRVAGGWYHACSRGHNREMIFGEERDYTHFLELLDAMREQFRVRVHAYCLMPNHYHLVEERIRQGTPEAWLQHVRWGLVLGSERFAGSIRRLGPRSGVVAGAAVWRSAPAGVRRRRRRHGLYGRCECRPAATGAGQARSWAASSHGAFAARM